MQTTTMSGELSSFEACLLVACDRRDSMFNNYLTRGEDLCIEFFSAHPGVLLAGGAPWLCVLIDHAKKESANWCAQQIKGYLGERVSGVQLSDSWWMQPVFSIQISPTYANLRKYALLSHPSSPRFILQRELGSVDLKVAASRGYLPSVS